MISDKIIHLNYTHMDKGIISWQHCNENSKKRQHSLLAYLIKSSSNLEARVEPIHAQHTFSRPPLCPWLCIYAHG